MFNSLEKQPQTLERITLNDGKRNIDIHTGDLLYLEADHVYTKVFRYEKGVVARKEILVRKSLNEFTEELPGNSFIRVHRGFIVNLKHVEEVGATYVKVGGVNIPIGRTFRDQVRVAVSL